MGGGSANIRSPEVLRRFRRAFVDFQEKAQAALQLVTGDLSSVAYWIEREQIPAWRAELRRREDQLKKTWREYIDARYGDRRMGKPSCVDERKAYERAKRRKEEAEEKIEVIKRWKIGLEQQAEKIMPPIKKLETLLDSVGPKAVARLTYMMDRLDEYLAPSSVRSAPEAPSAPGKEA
ncbi:MAG: hypothetical protein MUE73_11080 [Planctomycetes bacterium]|nr:hypothetical protein [Planctomycetota bacterium]